MAARHPDQLLVVRERLLADRTFIKALFGLVLIEPHLLELANLIVAGWWCSVSVWIDAAEVLQHIVHVCIFEQVLVCERKHWSRAMVDYPALLNTAGQVSRSLVSHFVGHVAYWTIFSGYFFAEVSGAVGALHIFRLLHECAFALVAPIA